PDGRRGRASPPVHRGQRPGREQPRRVSLAGHPGNRAPMNDPASPTTQQRGKTSMGQAMRAAIAVLATLVLCAAPAAAQDKKGGAFEPQVGQSGKDVIWVPTPDEVVNKMLDMAQVAPGDVVVDLGSGDGKIAIAAAKRGAVAHGVEYN